MNINEILETIKQNEPSTIGTQKEKTLHKVLKYYLCDDNTKHEVRIDSYYADVFVNNHIYEIQTRSFNAFRNKLTSLIQKYEVTVVYPIANIKTIYNVNENGEIASPRKSPKKGNPLLICAEQYKIKQLLTNNNLSFKLVLIDLAEYRYVTTNKYNWRKTTRIDQIPSKICQVIDLIKTTDYLSLLPEKLPTSFTSEEFQRQTRLSKRQVSNTLLVLRELQVIKKTGNIGRRYVYEIIKSN